MPDSDPVKTVEAFVTAINDHDPQAICALMSADHLFVDSGGDRYQGRDKMRAGWRDYLAIFPDYRISVDRITHSGEVVGLFGTASGTYCAADSPLKESPPGAGKLPKEDHWAIPAAWMGLVRDGLVAEWRVFCDVQPILSIMNRVGGERRGNEGRSGAHA